MRQSLEFHGATPLEYLERWMAANEVFGDAVAVASVIVWADQQVSFVITQPQYHGEKASIQEIESYFEKSGWQSLPNIKNHALYFNYAFGVLAIDALPRNCYVHEDALLPFDVILCRPDADLEEFLDLYPF